MNFQKNRISGISAPLVESNEDSFDKSYLEDIDINDSFNHIIESSIQITENSRNLFDSLIESNMKFTMDKLILSEATEESKDQNNELQDYIASNVSKVLSGMKKSIDQNAAKTNKRVNTLLKSDKVICNKNIDKINNSDLDGFKGIKNFDLPGKNFEKELYNLYPSEDINNSYNEFLSAVQKSFNAQDINDEYDKFKEKLSNIFKQVSDNSTKLITDNKVWKPTKDDIKVLSKFDAESIKKQITKVCKPMSKDLDKMDTDTVSIINTLDTDSNEFNITKSNIIYKASSELSRVIGSINNIICDLIIREIAAYRKAILACGCFITSNQCTDEVCESSDLYIANYFDK